jgi:hypothetical protein
MGGLGPGLGVVNGSPGPLSGHTSRLSSFWEGCRSVAPGSWMGTAYVIYPCSRALVMGRLMGRRFLGRLLIFFFWGTGEGKRNSSARNAETFFTGRCEFRTDLCVCYILYVEQWKFHCSMSSGHHEGGPRSSITLVRQVRSSGFNNPSTYTTY